MKTAGAIFIAAVVLILIPGPGTAKVWVLGFLIVVAVACLVDELLTARAHLAAQDHRIVDWFDELKAMESAEKADWEAWLGSTPSDRPLSSVTPMPSRVRKVTRFPAQRKPGADA